MDRQRSDKIRFIEYYRQSEIIALHILRSTLYYNNVSLDLKGVDMAHAGSYVSVRGVEFSIPTVIDGRTHKEYPTITGFPNICRVLSQYYFNKDKNKNKANMIIKEYLPKYGTNGEITGHTVARRYTLNIKEDTPISIWLIHKD